MMLRKLFTGLIMLVALTAGCRVSLQKDAASPTKEAFLPLRLGEVKPEGWLQAQLKRDLVSGYHGHLDDLIRDPQTGEFMLRPQGNDFVNRTKNKNETNS